MSAMNAAEPKEKHLERTLDYEGFARELCSRLLEQSKAHGNAPLVRNEERTLPIEAHITLMPSLCHRVRIGFYNVVICKDLPQ